MSFWRPDIDPEREPHKVLIRRDRFTDETRNGRAVPFKVYYPVGSDFKKLPVVLWSHGLGGSADGSAFLSRYIAGHGYVVVNMQHAGTDSGLWEGKPGHPWDVIRATPIPRSATIDRFLDVPFLINGLPHWLEGQEEIAPLADMGRLGMSGHSFGALTTQVMSGQAFPDENGALRKYPEGRIRAGILYSPVPMHHLTDAAGEVIYGGIDRPLFHMTGTDDVSPIEGFGYEKRLAVFEHAGHDDQHLLILKDGDHMVFTGSRGQLGENPKRKEQEAILKIASLAWWDAYLKNDAAARDWLTDGGFSEWLGAEGRYSVKAA